MEASQMPIHSPVNEIASVLQFTSRCCILPETLQSRPRGASQYVLCSIDDNRFAICRISATSLSRTRQVFVDESVTLQRDSQYFKDVQTSLVAHNTIKSDTYALENSDLLWISRNAVRSAVAVTLELLPCLNSQLLRDADTRSLMEQTLQRNVIVCVTAKVKLLTCEGLMAKTRDVEAQEQEQVMTFKVVSTYPAAPFSRITSTTRIVMTEPTKSDKADHSNEIASTITASDTPQSKGIQIGGLEQEQTALKELILMPIKYTSLRLDLGVELPKGILLCGPPGVGKTLLVRSVVHECRQFQDTCGTLLDLNLQVINGSELITSNRGDAEHALRNTFKTAMVHAGSKTHAASVIFIDEVDALCPKREAAGELTSSTHNRVVAQLLTLLDGIDSGFSRANVVVIAATNRPNAIDPALRRPGRLDREVYVAPPNTATRKKIFQVHLCQTPVAVSNKLPQEAEKQRNWFLETVAAKAVGYVGADIAALCREATMIASTRQVVAMSRDQELAHWWTKWQRQAEPCHAFLNKSSSRGAVIAARAWHTSSLAIIPLWFLANHASRPEMHAIQDEKDPLRHSKIKYFDFLFRNEKYPIFTATSHVHATNETFEVTLNDFDHAMQIVVPSALRGASGYMREMERQDWNSIGGHAKPKLALQQALEWPLKYPQTFTRLGVSPLSGLLLYGPPGCSKSSLVRAAAHSSGATFLSLSAAQVFSPFFGDAEAAVRQVFRDARAALPAIVFFDEIDAMVAKREFDESNDRGTSCAMRVLSTLLNEMDGVDSTPGLVVIGATNRPGCIDAALMRPGRFDRIIFVDLPTEADRVEILRIHSKVMPLDNDVDHFSLAKRTPFYSGAELENICREAALLALRESLEAKKVAMRHFNEALRGSKPVSSTKSMHEFITFAKTMGHFS
ncbi:hypothetical protein CCR75_001598 [Bremia lactucae]|uniref:AAA+ ATPase domain-containing protein n=1 Tax=Bremia lactucae TaxID=4779 RepID=A0A976FI24_BRELC|nr:hypothetical protein CCR75_001598 [Bremia lactucae]